MDDSKKTKMWLKFGKNQNFVVILNVFERKQDLGLITRKYLDMNVDLMHFTVLR